MTVAGGTEVRWIEDLCRYKGWPYAAGDAAFGAFGGRIFNPDSKTFQSLDRRVQHALAVWESKYGPFTPAQDQYAGRVLAWAIREGAREARSDPGCLYPYVLNQLAKVVNHEKVDAGMKRRGVSGETGSSYLDEVGELVRRVPR
jgi:hypothetical protein